ncbi:MAG TPA: type II toxin-antitoxin system VapC family toxin [Thermoanaerobaculia bacterium]|nr:type II toxin-antitoxin system VapC family toxin [Thermoanaerobaculia bacterium]
MVAVDTNVVVRLLTGDDADQLAVAEAAIADGAWISREVVLETAWALRSLFGFDHAEIALALTLLLRNDWIVVEDAEIIAAAVDQYRRRPALRFADCMILERARHAGHLPLLTFDKALSRLDGTTRLER